jgi:hypothetical protein
MSEPNHQFMKLLQILGAIDFDRRFYEFYDQIRNRRNLSGLGRKDWDAVLGRTGLSFRYTAKERLYTYEEQTSLGKIGLKIAFRHDEVEPILVCNLGMGEIGRPFQILAKSGGELKDPSFDPKPPYPTLPFTNTEELNQVIDFVIGLYSDAKSAILRFDRWNE